ncbi:CAP domain-containing protein [Paenibacillus periandrae]|uniref:CAP domain-containing protein n=1 Tax=Paenibacillus periandrae TaxID=1761741 RepID=UPI001F089750|nr:CAP domain-containing protein [Paenibacillus periandrae]
MKTFFIIATIILAAGCAKNDGMTRIQQTTPKEAITHASSISTTEAQHSTITVKQDPFTLPQWLAGGQVPGTGTNPVTNPGTSPTTNPGTSPVTNPEANLRTNPITNPITNPGASPTTNPGTNPITNPGANPADKTPASSPYEQQVLQLVNKQRTDAGLGALMMDNKLSQMALAKAQDMYNNNYFDHNSPTYGSPFQMMDKFQISYNTAGENIAKGQTSPEQVMNEWMNSPGHRANILNNTYTKIGVGYYNGEWVQEFIS